MLVSVMVKGGCANVAGLIPGTLELAEKNLYNDTIPPMLSL